MSNRRSTFVTQFFAAVSLLALSSLCAASVHAETTQSAPLNPATVKNAIEAITKELREAYVFPDKGYQAANALEKSLAENAYATMTDPGLFAKQLTEQLRAVTQDSHMRVIAGSPFAGQPKPSGPPSADFEAKRLDGNVGYIHLSRFVPPDLFNSAADAAIRSLSDTDAMIVDMRDNGGGHPGSVAYLASFFLNPEKRIHINDLIWRNRGTSTFKTETFWNSPTPVSYLDKPLYILVGPKTYSAGEEFAYDLQTLKRATVVGEKTRGGANPGGLTKIGDELFVVVPTGRAENPITHTNWGGVGVQPDIKASADASEQKALALAQERSTATKMQ